MGRCRSGGMSAMADLNMPRLMKSRQPAVCHPGSPEQPAMPTQRTFTRRRVDLPFIYDFVVLQAHTLTAQRRRFGFGGWTRPSALDRCSWVAFPRLNDETGFYGKMNALCP